MVKVLAPSERHSIAVHQQFERFLCGELIDGGWNHLGLIKMAAMACLEHPEQEVDVIRQGLVAINARFMKPGHEGYHHTLTCFWIDIVKHWINQADLSSVTFWSEIEDVFYDSRISLQFYSQQLLDRPEAKLEYLGPDIAPLGLPAKLDSRAGQLWRRFCFQDLVVDEWDLSVQMRIALAAARLYPDQFSNVLNAGIHRLRAKVSGGIGHFDSAFCVSFANLAALKLATRPTLTDQQLIGELSAPNRLQQSRG